jgi:hypothetical protein
MPAVVEVVVFALDQVSLCAVALRDRPVFPPAEIPNQTFSPRSGRCIPFVDHKRGAIRRQIDEID